LRRNILQIFSLNFLMLFLNTEADSVTPIGSASFQPEAKYGTTSFWLGTLVV